VYERVSSNVRKSYLLIASFAVFVIAVGWAFGHLTGVGHWGLVVAVVLSLLMTWGSYFNSDKIALAMSRARPADEREHAQLHNLVEGLAIAAGMPKPRVYVVEDGAPNAFATGRNPDRGAIAVTTGLIAKMNRDELEGVIAHELSHIKNRDTLVMTLTVTLVGVVVLLADWMIRALWWGSGTLGGKRGSGARGLVALLGAILLLLAPLFAQVIQLAISRRREYLADADAVLLTRYPDGLIRALEKLRDDRTAVRSASRATAHLWIESPLSAERAPGEAGATTPGAWLNRLFETHPPLESRIAALRQSALGAATG
jgi:heat shock protein HtpX